MPPRILHLDMDAFYASVEQLDDPELAGKPVIVGGKGPRSVVAACSYEARKYGVHSALSMQRALDFCPQAVVVKPRMERYREISKGIFDCLREQVPIVEQMSVDEAYLDISEEVSSEESARALGKRLKEEIRERFHLTCSIGIAPCKFAAKIASDLKKPDALVVVSEKELLCFLAPLEVDRIPGVGKVGLRKLNGIGVRTIGDLRAQQRDSLLGLFGKWGHRLYDFARGIDPRPVITEYERKSLGAEYTFDTDVRDWKTLCDTIGTQSARLAELLRKTKRRVRTVLVKVRYANFEQVTRQESFSHSVQEAEEIASVARKLLVKTQANRRAVRLVGVAVSSFEESGGSEELPLFGGREDRRKTVQQENNANARRRKDVGIEQGEEK